MNIMSFTKVKACICFLNKQEEIFVITSVFCKKELAMSKWQNVPMNGL